MNLMLAGGRLSLFALQGAQAMSSLGGVALIAVSTYFVIDGMITLGTMMMFFVFRTFFVERLNRCVSYLVELRRVQTHAERIDEVLTDEARAGGEVFCEPFIVAPECGVGIEVRDLWFRYGDDSPWIFKGAGFCIEPGESVAIAGPSGSGKTTLMNVLLGLLEPTRGEVLVNGRDLRTIPSHDYARVIGAVMQDDTLFHGTVAENISFFDAPFDMVRIARAAEKANIARDIGGMPMQYYSVLAEAAVNISGGQKQRLFIARAVYHEPKLLLLDEATSHLDAESERLSHAVRGMNLTRILIAHRRETIATADRVLHLDQNGGVSAQEHPRAVAPLAG